MCKAEFKDKNDIEWHWYKCKHFWNKWQICVEERDENHTTHTFEETKIDISFNRQWSTWGSYMPGPMHVRTFVFTVQQIHFCSSKKIKIYFFKILYHLTTKKGPVTHDKWHVTCKLAERTDLTWQRAGGGGKIICVVRLNSALSASQDMWHIACDMWHAVEGEHSLNISAS